MKPDAVACNWRDQMAHRVTSTESCNVHPITLLASSNSRVT